MGEAEAADTTSFAGQRLDEARRDLPLTQAIEHFHAIFDPVDGNDVGICFVMFEKALQDAAGNWKKSGWAGGVQRRFVVGQLLLQEALVLKPVRQMLECENCVDCPSDVIVATSAILAMQGPTKTTNRSLPSFSFKIRPWAIIGDTTGARLPVSSG